MKKINSIVRGLPYLFIIIIFQFCFNPNLLSQTNTFPSTGNVGIGTVTPGSKLDVVGDIAVGYAGWRTGIINSLYLSPDEGVTYTAKGHTGGWYGVHDFYTTYDNGSPVFAMRIKNGNVGIGTTGANTKLEVSSSSPIVRITSSTTNTDGRLEFYDNSAVTAYLLGNNNAGNDYTIWGRASGDDQISMNAAHTIEFKSNGSSAMTITSGGNVQIAGSLSGLTYPYSTYVGSMADATHTFVRAGSTSGYLSWFEAYGGSHGSYPNIVTIGTASVERIRILANGNVGIHQTNPVDALEIGSGAASTNKYVTMNTAYSYAAGMKIMAGGSDRWYLYRPAGSDDFRIYGNGLDRLTILHYNGNVLIGKTSQSNNNYKLDVAGKIRADEVVVNTTGADYVFETDYNLLELSEIEKFIEENKHLPGIASAQEMQQNGMNISEMQTKLLQKIEELTLYSIEQGKKIYELEKKNNALENEVKELKPLIIKTLNVQIK